MAYRYRRARVENDPTRVDIYETATTIVVRSPKILALVDEFHLITGAKWDWKEAVWHFPLSHSQLVRWAVTKCCAHLAIFDGGARVWAGGGAPPAAAPPPPPAPAAPPVQAGGMLGMAQAILNNPASTPRQIDAARRMLAAAAPPAPVAPMAGSGPLMVAMMVTATAAMLDFPYDGSWELRQALKAISCPIGWQKFDPATKLWSFPAAQAAAVRAACRATPDVVLEEEAAPEPAPAPSVSFGPVNARTSEAAARAVLGVPPEADHAAVKRAFRTASKSAHPDRPGGSHARQQEVNAAWAVLDALLSAPPAIAA